MNHIYIRTATTDDAELIAAISAETFYESFAAQNTKEDMEKFLTENFSKEILLAQVGIPGHIFLLAYTDDEPAGYVFLKDTTAETLEEDNVIEISRIYARSSFIGKGIGKALMEAAIAQAKFLKKDSIWLGVWEHNLRAIQFYISFGFTKFSEHDFVLGNDVQRDWLMKRSVII
jgi:ribosomal protein S18 acetylase RimI-like enzyme